MSVYHQLIHIQLTTERKRKQKKSEVIKAYNTIVFLFFVCFPCLSEIFGWFVCALLQADSQVNGRQGDLKGSP